MMPKITKFSGDYSFLSNFHHSQVEFEGDIYPTVEHAFQAAKATDPVVRMVVKSARTPGEAKKIGRKVILRPDWEDMKVETMLNLLRSKFSDSTLSRKLLDTGNSELIEGNPWGDRFWGVSGGGKGYGNS